MSSDIMLDPNAGIVWTAHGKDLSHRPAETPTNKNAGIILGIIMRNSGQIGFVSRSIQ